MPRSRSSRRRCPREDDGLAFGAVGYCATTDDATFDQLAGRFDLIVDTVSTTLPMEKYRSMLRLDGTLVLVGIPPEPQSLEVGALLDGRRS